ncbi:CBS domain-containing protein [Rhodothermus marinus]|uniref:CBS domain-containing protein n=1 Tax=Rhodothermus marinus TaxID=29549 RepID=UPI0037C5D0B5
MRIAQLIQEGLQPLSPGDTVHRAREQMAAQRIRHLPVVNEAGELLGVVSDEQLRLVDDPNLPVAMLVRGTPVSVTPDLHVFDAARVVLQHGLTVLPVAESNHHYRGAVSGQHLLEQLIRMLSLHEPGAILELEIDARDYALSNLLYCVEQCDARVRALVVEPLDASESRFRVTLKLNVQDTARIRHVLEHRGFHVAAAYNEEDDEELRQRIEAFMRYLEV